MDIDFTVDQTPRLKRLTKKQVENRLRLTKALRSGKYKQAEGSLRKEGVGFCCLGVACDVAAPDKWKRDSDGDWMHQGEIGEPVDSRLRSLGFDVPTGEGNFTNVLIKMNDDGREGERYDFNDIADVIELDTLMRQDGAL